MSDYDPGTERDAKLRNERDETDASLKAERSKADNEHGRAMVEREADRVVEVARDRAESILRVARELADRDMTTAGVGSEARKEIELERVVADGAMAEEHQAADRLLYLEREARERALIALLRLEREATDDVLMLERTRADEAVATRDDFLAIVSHDLRNMLGGIALSAEMLAEFLTRDGDHGAATLRHAERIQRFTARMNRLVGDLIDVVSLEAGKLQVTTRPTHVSELVQEVIDTFQSSFAAKGISLGAELASGVVVVQCDHDRIIQVLANLLGNALKFTERGGQVTLSVGRSESEVCFSVADTGVGIPDSEALAVFERFRQVGSRKDRAPGLGLGLYIAKCIVEAHGGTIWVDRPTAVGTTLSFTLRRSDTSAS